MTKKTDEFEKVCVGTRMGWKDGKPDQLVADPDEGYYSGHTSIPGGTINGYFLTCEQLDGLQSENANLKRQVDIFMRMAIDAIEQSEDEHLPAGDYYDMIEDAMNQVNAAAIAKELE